MTQTVGTRPDSVDGDTVAAFSGLIEDRFGLRLSKDQARNLGQKIGQLVIATRLADSTELLSAFASGWRTDLLEGLVGELTIGETHFFRIGPQIDALRRVVLPDVIARRADERRLRLWSAGCSTGEEPFTLAILVREQLPSPQGWNLEILASDITRSALDAAQRATYGSWSFRDTPEDVRERYFTRQGTRWQLMQPVRRMVQFSRLNLATDAFPGAEPGRALDLILCRNVTIYFSPVATQAIYRRFVESLAPGGWLVLGPSDPPPDSTVKLQPMFLPGAVLWQKEPAGTRPPATQTKPRVPLSSAPVDPRPIRANASDRATPVRRSDATGVLSAREQAQAAALASPLSAEAHLLLGMLYLDEGNRALALGSLRRAAFLNPVDPLAQFSLGLAWDRSGDADRARMALRQARRFLADVSDDVQIGGGAKLEAGELRHAIETQLTALRGRTAS